MCEIEKTNEFQLKNTLGLESTGFELTKGGKIIWKSLSKLRMYEPNGTSYVRCEFLLSATNGRPYKVFEAGENHVFIACDFKLFLWSVDINSMRLLYMHRQVIKKTMLGNYHCLYTTSNELLVIDPKFDLVKTMELDSDHKTVERCLYLREVGPGLICVLYEKMNSMTDSRETILCLWNIEKKGVSREVVPNGIKFVQLKEEDRGERRIQTILYAYRETEPKLLECTDKTFVPVEQGDICDRISKLDLRDHSKSHLSGKIDLSGFDSLVRSHKIFERRPEGFFCVGRLYDTDAIYAFREDYSIQGLVHTHLNPEWIRDREKSRYRVDSTGNSLFALRKDGKMEVFGYTHQG